MAVHAEVGDERDEAAEEVAEADGQGAHEGPRGVGLGVLVVEAHEEVEEGGGGVVQRGGDGGGGGRREVVRREDSVDEGGSLERGKLPDLFLSGGNGGAVGFSG